MGASITLKNISDPIYVRLKAAAAAHHRSLNSEVIACLERQMIPTVVSVEERLWRARKLRESLDPDKFRTEDIAQAIRQGRA